MKAVRASCCLLSRVAVDTEQTLGTITLMSITVFPQFAERKLEYMLSTQKGSVQIVNELMSVRAPQNRGGSDSEIARRRCYSNISEVCARQYACHHTRPLSSPREYSLGKVAPGIYYV